MGARSTIGDFDGDGDFLDDLDGDGLAEIVTVDNRFLYQFDCYACSAAPLVIYTVRGGKVIDVTTEPRFRAAHRDWLKQLEDERRSGDALDLAGLPRRLGGGEDPARRRRRGLEGAQRALGPHDSDEGEEVCLTGGEPEDCPKKNRAVLKFPERLKLFLEQNGYGS